MPLPRRRVAIALLAAVVVNVGVAAVTSLPAGASSPGSQAAQEEANEKVATLEIITPGASVKRADQDEFKPAKDGQKLRVGDTIQTDATGFVVVNFADDSFTRLDINTTFTIEAIVDDEGNRTIKGKVESGQTWNRVEALTENESFEQEGAGATAAVTGTAFAVSCLSPGNCTFYSLVDGVTLTTIDGEVQTLDPLQVCESDEIDETNADLCEQVGELTEAAVLANAWLMKNIYLDGLLGYEGPVFGVIVVQDGVVQSFTPTSGPIIGTPTDTTPVVPDPSVNITSNGSGLQDEGPQDEIVTDESNNVFFTINTGGATWIIFTDLFEDDPNDLFELGAGFAAESGDSATTASSEYCEAPPFGVLYFWDEEEDGWYEVEIGIQYANNTEFMFEPSEVEPPFIGDLRANEIGYSETGDFTFYVQSDGGPASDPETVEVTVYDTYGVSTSEQSASDSSAPAPEPAPEPAPADTTTDTEAQPAG